MLKPYYICIETIQGTWSFFVRPSFFFAAAMMSLWGAIVIKIKELYAEMMMACRGGRIAAAYEKKVRA